MEAGCWDGILVAMTRVLLLQKPVLKKPNITLGELENLGLLCRRAQRSRHSKL